ncbi:hypothetical protein KFU94_10285 [Chloroflexi bacterium TSY]|nr:hypothetical protein [Chloroflexi bacterium TSY]
MSRQRYLRDIAHARAGDKGNRSSIGLFVYDAAYFEAVRLNQKNNSYGKSRVQKMTIRGEILEQPSVCMKNLYPTFAATEK